MISIEQHAKRAESLREKVKKNTSEIVATQKEMASWPFFRNIEIGELTWDHKRKIITFSGGTPILDCDYETMLRFNKEMSTFREQAMKTLEKEFADPIPEPNDDEELAHVAAEPADATPPKVEHRHGKK